MTRILLVTGAFLHLATTQAMARIDLATNHLSDVWEVAYGQGLAPEGDSDGDGFSNLEEAIAGTDPHDGTSYPRSSFVTHQDNQILIRFDTIPGVQYQVELSPNLSDWFPASPTVSGSGHQQEISMSLEDTAIPTELTLSVWTGLTGYGVGVIQSYVATGSPPPDFVREISLLNFPPTNPDEEQFGRYIGGWLIPPETGVYTFWLASDDGSELWLSTNSLDDHLSLAASVPGWTAYQQWDKYPEQQSLPLALSAGQRYAFSVYQRESYGGDHLSVAWTRPTAPPQSRDLIGWPYLTAIGQSLRELDAGGTLAFRLTVREVDSDQDGVSDYEESMLGLNANLATTTPRQPDYDAALRILGSGSAVTIGASTPRAYEAGAQAGAWTVYRSGGIDPIRVSYTVSGTAQPGSDYLPLTGTVDVPAGTKAVHIPLEPLPDGVLEPAETVVVTLLPGTNYSLGTPASATVTLDDAEDVLYVAQLRPVTALLGGGSGIAAVRRTGNALGSVVSLSFGGLTSLQLGSDLLVSSNGIVGTTVLNLPSDQVASLAWTFDGTNGLTREDILNALDAEALWVRIRSEGQPGGELVGQLLRQPGWTVMPAPPTPPPAPTNADSRAEAARFLAQATFGPTMEDITALTSTTYAAWIDAQLALPPTLHLPFVQARRAELLAREGNDGWQGPRHEAWWQHAITAPDQLRQRMAFALSQILVISQFGALDSDHEGVTLYYDRLLALAFGNYRELIEEVTLSPMMGTYLSMMRNRKPDPVTGHEPDENYAREIMQLFTVGLTELHPDGSLRLDEEGLPIPTYSQEDTVGLAHIFTGWSAHYDPTNPPTWSNGSIADPDDWFQWGWDAMRPMSFYPNFHDTEDRVILGNTLIPAGTNGYDRLSQALDTLFNHPNLGPFLARQLIQRFVTSNPSPGYIHRVAAAFHDNGQGVRGDLGATLTALLLDPEARHPADQDTISNGKPMEPVLRLTRMLRAFTPNAPFAASGDDRLFLNFQYAIPEQAPLNAPSVFNFFQPVYRQPGAIARAGLYSPEFQIFAETTAIGQANLHYSIINWGLWIGEPEGTNDHVVLQLNLDRETALLDDPAYSTPAEAQAALLNHLDQLLLCGGMTSTLRADIQGAFDELPSWFGYTADRQRRRVQTALYLILNSPEFFVTQ
ncbi:MAG: DUF1800 family protein [Kiritimatiellae bacterium]|nr:DUF1800 family protein [Kiritimatiellia bacterium]